MSRTEIETYENKTVHIKFKNRRGDPNEAYGRIMQTNGESLYLRLFDGYWRVKILYSNITYLAEIQVREN